jgi:hypothetical protein
MYHGFKGFMIGVLCILGSALFIGQAAALPKTADSVKAESGTVVETMKAPGYTYMLVADGPKQNWVAIPATNVETGAKVRYTADMVMENFTSKTLKKTFETIIFSAGLLEGASEAPEEAAADDSFSAAVKSEQSSDAAEPAMPASGGSSGAVAPLQEISVAKAEAENGYSVEELFSKAKELDGKNVQLRGKVVKFSANIMGKNWVHVQDGTGNPMNNTHDMVVTTSETVEVAAIVTLEGTLAADKDFGAGYKYAAIIEQASLIK